MKNMYLNYRVEFGKYREKPMTIKEILDTEDGCSWFEWLMKNNWNFTITSSVIEYYKTKKEEHARPLLQ